jgi:hypothetical protein
MTRTDRDNLPRSLRRLSRRGPSWLALGALIAASCGGGRSLRGRGAATDGGEGGPTFASADSGPLDSGVERSPGAAAFLADAAPFCAEKARHVCQHLDGCGTIYAPVGTCLARETVACMDDLGTWPLRAADLGRARFDAAGSAVCLAAIDASDCVVIDPQNVCRQVVGGLLPDGASCVHPEECAGRICDEAFQACAGTCASPSRPGQPCTGSGGHICLAGVAWCDDVSGDCQAKKATGAPCIDDGNAFTESQCGAGDYCASPSGHLCGEILDDVQGCLCKPLGVMGTTCNASNPCRSDLSCIDGACRGPGAAGDDCDFGPDACAGDLSCVPKTLPYLTATVGVCRPFQPVGASCMAFECAPGSSCVMASPDVPGLCTKDPEHGQPCRPDQRCPTGDFCGDAGICAKRPVEGERCDPTALDICWGENLVCVTTGASGICARHPRPGEPCAGGCEPGAYCQDQVCAVQKAAGAPCFTDDECASARCLIPLNCVGPDCDTLHCGDVCAYPPAADGGT